MKHLLLVSLALSAGLTAPVLAQAPVTPAPATPAAAPATATTGATRVNGQVTVDTSKTPTAYTVAGRNGATTTFTLAPDAKVTRIAPAQQTDLQVGNWVTVNGPLTGDTTDKPAITANTIALLPGEPAGGKGKRAGLHRNRVDGKIATLTLTGTPAMTLTTKGGVTVPVTLNTVPATRYERSAAAAPGDIATGERIQARVVNGAATEVTIQPARARRGRRGNRAAATATP